MLSLDEALAWRSNLQRQRLLRHASASSKLSMTAVLDHSLPSLSPPFTFFMMKTFTKVLLAAGLALVGRSAAAQVLYDDFENTRRVTYGQVDGALDQNANNPGSSTANSSTKCGKYDRNAVQYAVIVLTPTASPSRMANVSAYSAGTKTISMKFRSPGAGTAVQIVLQNKTKAATGYPNGNYAGTFNATTTVAANNWQTLTFAFTAGAAGSSFDPTVTATDVDQMVMLVAPNTTTPTTFYIDDLMGPELVTSTVTTPVLLDDFETTRLLNYPTVQGTLNQAAANPGSSTANSSTTCASFARDGSQQYATIVLTPKNGKFADVSGYASSAQKFTMKFRSPAAGTAVQIVLQNRVKTANNYPNGNYAGTFNATTTAAANTWETLTFTFTAGTGGSYDPTVGAADTDQLALLIAPGSSSASTYYFDDLMGPAITTATAARASIANVAAFEGAYPNPANGLVHLPISLQKSAVVSLTVFDNLGRQVATVLDGQLHAAGTFEAELNSAKLTPGLYTCRLTVDGQPLTRQLSVE